MAEVVSHHFVFVVTAALAAFLLAALYGDCYRDIGARHDSQGLLRGAVSVRKFG